MEELSAFDVLKDSYEWIKSRELELHQQIVEWQFREEKKRNGDIPAGAYGEHAEVLSDGVIKVTIPELIPPYSVNTYDLNKKLRSRITGMVVKALFPLQGQIQINDALLLIVHFFPNKRISDLDNRANKYFIDGIRYSRLIPDDSWMHFSFMTMGALDKKRPHSDLYLFDMEKQQNIFHQWILKLRNL
jgi:hypothetical protein